MVLGCLSLPSGHDMRQEYPATCHTLQHAILSPAALTEVSGLKSRHDPESFLLKAVKAH